jgi:hypothetical protein
LFEQLSFQRFFRRQRTPQKSFALSSCGRGNKFSDARMRKYRGLEGVRQSMAECCSGIENEYRLRLSSATSDRCQTTQNEKGHA